MEFAITQIERVELPNCPETTWAGKEATTKPAPLLAKYRVTIEAGDQRGELLLEIRSQPRGTFLVDEYEEDGLLQAVMPFFAAVASEKRRLHLYNEAIRHICDFVGAYWLGEVPDPPWKRNLCDPQDAQPRRQR